MSLARVPPAGRCRIIAIRGNAPLSQRLMELGFIEGAEVQVVRRAPLGDPLQVRLGDCDLLLRASEANLIDVAIL